MKKLFISCPMKDRTEAQIRGTMMQMHRIAEAVFGEELEVIQTYIPDPPSGMNQALWCLGESIKMLSEADYFIGVYDEEKRTVVVQSRTRPQRLTAFPVTPST